MKTFLNKIQEEKQILQATCNGKKTCGQCKMHVLDNNLPVTKEEEIFLTPKEIIQGIRLACCHEYVPDIKYTLLDESMNILDDINVHQTMNEEGYGLIVDIGTTTIVMKWILGFTGESKFTVSFKNPQSTYGGDVISRIRYSTQHPHVLNQVLIHEIEEKILEHQDIEINRMIVCGNTVMTHLFLDADVTSLGHVPFDIPIPSMQKILSTKLFPRIHQSFDIYTLPHISAFVGGDIVAGIAAVGMDKSTDMQMLIDLGTNGEIVIGNKDQLTTTSTAAGPAFEGVGISCGGPSIYGAITKVKIDGKKVMYQTIGHHSPLCICGSGLISLIAELKRNEIINEIGRFVDHSDKFYITDRIYISEKDIQTFQLAKAAIQAGVTTLFKEKGDVSKIYISGGFGAHIDIEDLIELNIFPREYIGKIKNVKNSALSGAYILLQTQDYERYQHIVEISQNINLAEYPYFQDLLIDGLYF